MSVSYVSDHCGSGFAARASQSEKSEARANLMNERQSTESSTSASTSLVAEKMVERAEQAATLLKSLSHSGRLMILCNLISGPKSVGELADRVKLSQVATSVLLTRLRLEGIVSTRRDGKSIHYSLADPRAANIVACVYEAFCGDAKS